MLFLAIITDIRQHHWLTHWPIEMHHKLQRAKQIAFVHWESGWFFLCSRFYVCRPQTNEVHATTTTTNSMLFMRNLFMRNMLTAAGHPMRVYVCATYTNARAHRELKRSETRTEGGGGGAAGALEPVRRRRRRRCLLTIART